MILNEVCKMDLSKNNAPKEPEVYTEDKTMQEMFLKTTGRLNRLRYFKRGLVVLLASLVVGIPALMIFSDEWGNLTSFGNLISVIINLATFIPMYCLAVRRLHDLDKDETLAKISLGLGVVGIIMGMSNDDFSSMSAVEMIVYGIDSVICLYILFAPGTKGENKYGPDPLG